MAKNVARANNARSKVRSAVEHVFARQKGPMALVVRTIVLARATVKIGLANLAYNMFALGGGLDYKIKSYITVRGDFEFQHWSGFPPNGLTPMVGTVGVAYHFH